MRGGERGVEGGEGVTNSLGKVLRYLELYL